MTRQQKHIIIFFLTSVLTYTVWQVYFVTDTTITDKPFTKGYSIENIELRITNETGKLVGKFKSPGLVRYTGSDIIHISKPVFWTYNNGIQQWNIKSETAEFNSKNNEISFTEKLTADSMSDNPKTHFTANSLLVMLDKNLAITNNGIEFKQPDVTMSGQKATLDLKQQTIEVNDNVKAIYKAPQQNNK